MKRASVTGGGGQPGPAQPNSTQLVFIFIGKTALGLDVARRDCGLPPTEQQQQRVSTATVTALT